MVYSVSGKKPNFISAKGRSMENTVSGYRLIATEVVENLCIESGESRDHGVVATSVLGAYVGRCLYFLKEHSSAHYEQMLAEMHPIYDSVMKSLEASGVVNPIQKKVIN